MSRRSGSSSHGDVSAPLAPPAVPLTPQKPSKGQRRREQRQREEAEREARIAAELEALGDTGEGWWVLTGGCC